MPRISYTKQFDQPNHDRKTFQVKVEGIKKGPDGKPEIDPTTNKPKKETIYELADVVAPAFWSQHSVDIAASKYFVKARVPDGKRGRDGKEVSVFEMVDRVAMTIAKSGVQQGYFDGEPSASAFYGDLFQILIGQYAAFNSPVWFNVGLYHQYGIKGNGVNYGWCDSHPSYDSAVDGPYGTQPGVYPIENYYERPQASACFIQPVEDNLTSIFHLLKAESLVFKGGSGSGSNFSKIRSRWEKLSGGGLSSGLLSFLKVLDAAAGSIKSGGTTRRAAKMVILDADHPEIFDFIRWKSKEELKAKALIAAGYDPDFNGEAYQTIAGQNANNSVRVTDAFMQAVEEDGPWSTTYRTNGQVHETFPARQLFREMAQAAWACADPGIQYDGTIQKWHTVPVSGRINGTNPCSEFLHVDDSACNLSSINLIKFLRPDGTFDSKKYIATIRCLIIAMDILVDLSSYPTASIANVSHHLRPLGIGYANLGALLMALGIPYDSDLAREWAAVLTSLLSAEGYATSAAIAGTQGAFGWFEQNKEPMLKVMGAHLQETIRLSCTKAQTSNIKEAAKSAWVLAIQMGDTHGFRNSQISLLAPTGTISFLMGCDTTGVEPDFALIKHKKLAGGGDMYIVNDTVKLALERLDYSEKEVLGILNSIAATGTPTEHPLFKKEHAPIFDCAMPAKPGGTFISPMGHLKMVAAVQPFLSGAVSKTINVPNETTVEEIEELYLKGWKMGIKAMAVYRDGCKLSQPLNTKPEVISVPEKSGSLAEAQAEIARLKGLIQHHMNQRGDDACWKDDAALYEQALGVKDWNRGMLPKDQFLSNCAKYWECQTIGIPYQTPQKPKRMRLPTRRVGVTHELRIGGRHKVYLRTGEYADGAIGEIFIDMHKQGSMMRALLGNFAIAVSLGLQYGVPLEEFVDVFTFSKFEPAGMTNHPNIKQATSVIDFVFRILGLEYLGREDLCHVKPSELEESEKMQVRQRAKVQGVQIRKIAEKLAEEVTEVEKDTSVQINGHGTPSTGLQLVTQSDAPECPDCGELTVRNGACYKCSNCGTSLGCS